MFTYYFMSCQCKKLIHKKYKSRTKIKLKIKIKKRKKKRWDPMNPFPQTSYGGRKLLQRGRVNPSPCSWECGSLRVAHGYQISWQAPLGGRESWSLPNLLAPQEWPPPLLCGGNQPMTFHDILFLSHTSLVVFNLWQFF